MKKQFISVGILIVLFISTTASFAAEDVMMDKKSDDSMMMHKNTIVDVTAGKEFRGVITSSDAAGYAKAYYTEEDWYILHAKINWLTQPEWDDFYEWWVVRKSPFAFISTWKLLQAEIVNGHYENNFSSTIDYTDYDFYVLTLEPNDGNDAPADHILEGNIAVVMEGMMMKKDETMMKDSMMEKDKMMQSGEMMKKTMTPLQKALRMSIKTKLANIDASKVDIEKVSMRIQAYKENLEKRGFSSAKKARYIELLDAILDVITEMKMMTSDTMMDK